YTLTDAARARLEAYHGRWDSILGFNGPVDEPAACLSLSLRLQEGLNFRQAAQNLERNLFFDPDNRAARLSLCLMCVKALLPDLALKHLADFRSRPAAAKLPEEEELNLIAIEALAHVLKDDL